MRSLLMFLLLLNQALWLSGQISADWKAQAAGYVIEGYTTPDPGLYSWHEEGNISQGVHISVLPSEIIPVYIEQGNNYLNFTTRISPDLAYEFMVNIEVNVNGAGWYNLYNGSPRQDVVWFNSSQVFASTGTYLLQVMIQEALGQEYYREYNIVVIPASSRLFKDNYGNTLRLWPSTLPGVHRPVLFSEGFDAYDTNPQQMYYSAAQELIACMREQGFDIYLLNNIFGTQDIRNNAAGYSAAVRFVSAQSINQPIIAGGVSMGGMIARYAHAKAENDGNPLPVYAFLSVDSPQQGAIVSQPLQDYKKEKTAGNTFAEHALNNLAAKQLLNYCTYDPGGGIHQAFYNELNSLNGNGYPHLSKNIGVTFAINEPNPAIGEWIHIEWMLGPFQGEAASFDLTPDERLPGSWLPVDLTTTNPMVMRLSSWAWNFQIQPFNYPTVSVVRTKDPTYIAYQSALDIVNGQSKFDVTVIPDHTTHHDVLPQEIIDDILCEISFASQWLQNTTISGQASFAGTEIRAGSNVNPWLPQGDVVIVPGAEVQLAATEKVKLETGFRSIEGSHCNVLADPGMTVSCNKLNETAGTLDTDFPLPVSYTDIVFKGEEEQGMVSSSQPVQNENELQLFPNPVGEHLIILFDNAVGRQVMVELRDLSGRLVYSNSLTGKRLEVDMSDLPPGIYILQLSTTDLTFNERIIKM